MLLMSTALLSAAHAAEDDIELELDGYYRTRAYVYPSLYKDQDEAGRYLNQRLRQEAKPPAALSVGQGRLIHLTAGERVGVELKAVRTPLGAS